MRTILVAIVLTLPACVATPPIAPPSPAPRRSALAFFDGRTEGVGTLHIAFKRAAAVHVHGRGHLDGGTLILDQSVERGGTSAKERKWHMRETSSGHYTGTLTDARGPITGDAVGNRLHLAFRSKSGLDTQQWLTLAPNGRSARNIMVVRRFGIKVAVLDETIRKIG